jgi:predicted Rossmann fold nucleotide-binding protein DprA/Smf involved in DNA uptake
VELGAIGFPSIDRNGNVSNALADALTHRPARLEEQELSLYAEAGSSSSSSAASVRESADVKNSIPEASEETIPQTFYEAILPKLLSVLDKPVTVDELVKQHDVAKGQLQAWLKQAVQEKHVKKLSKPARYVRA